MTIRVAFAAALLACAFGTMNAVAAEDDVYPTALLTFEERGANVKDYGQNVSDILFAELVANPNLYLVDRQELAKTLGEQSLNISGAVKADEAAQVGQLTGAKLLITGSVLQVDKKLYLVAKIMGTETTRVAGASVNGKATDDLGELVTQLAEKISATITNQGDKLVAKKADTKDRAAILQKQLAGAQLPTVRIEIPERHVGQVTTDPAAETEMVLLAQAAGFEVIDNKEGSASDADVLITGEGFSETAGRLGAMTSVRARLEVKAVDRKTGRVLATGRHTAVIVGSSEQIAGKSALQEAGAELAERVLPKLVLAKDAGK